MYLPFVSRLGRSDLVEKGLRAGYEWDARMCALNRVGTPAAALPDQVPADVSTDRIERLIKAQDRHTEACLRSLIGTTQEVLVTDKSRRDETMMTGKCGRNININFKGTEEDLGRILPVRVISAGRTTLRGEKIPEAADHE